MGKDHLCAFDSALSVFAVVIADNRIRVYNVATGSLRGHLVPKAHLSARYTSISWGSRVVVCKTIEPDIFLKNSLLTRWCARAIEAITGTRKVNESRLSAVLGAGYRLRHGRGVGCFLESAGEDAWSVLDAICFDARI
jgi:hypothetical protein